MVNPFEKTPMEKEEYVKDMLQRGYSYSQIMRECHVSPSTISKVRKEFFGGECDGGSKNNGQISKETQALKLFNQGRSLLDVAIELDIPSESVMAMYENFQRLKNMENFISAYNQVKGNIYPFLRLFDLMNCLDMTPEQVAQQVNFGIKLPFLGNMCSELSGRIQSLNWQKQQLGIQLDALQNEIEKGKSAFNFYLNECQAKKNEIVTLGFEIDNQKSLIKRFDNEEGHIRIKEAAKMETKLIMQNIQAVSAVTLSATVEAIRRYPDSQKLFFDIVTSQIDAGPSDQNPQIQSHVPQIRQLIQQVQNEMAERISGIIVHGLNSVST